MTSLRFDHQRVTLPALLLTLASDSQLRASLRTAAPSLLHLNLASLEAQLAAQPAVRTEAIPSNSRPSTVPAAGGEDFLAAYATDLTQEARDGRIDRVIGRDPELRQMVDILMRRRQNNPILVGEAGVGKTAIVEAFARMIADGEAPEMFAETILMTLDLSLLQAGAGVKGEFERRLKGVVDQVKTSATPVILFIDEAHTIIGAGGQQGQGDAANILKPALARGELRTIAATTWAEYKKYFEKDPALTRRFQTVKVDEPDVETAVRMMRAIAPNFRKHHDIRIRDSALRAAVELSHRYLPGRQLPDKAVSLIDTASASVAMSRQTVPAALGDARREVELLEAEIAAVESEPLSAEIPKRLKELRKALGLATSEVQALEARRTEEDALIAQADVLEAEPTPGDQQQKALAQTERKLSKIQGDVPLVHRLVDAEAVAAVVARWTGVPLGRLMKDQIATVTELEDRLKRRIIGQDAAIATISDAMRTARAGLNDPRRPPGVFLMVGTSGVGKTETALALADELYGGPQNLTTINMSEFKEEHKVSLLMGSPPGYVGYGEGGVLTEAVRRRPYGVLLLDEMDKAHPGVQDIFYQLFDKGTLRDGEGRDIDFKNTTIMMTANTGTETLATLAEDPETMPEGEELAEVLKDALLTQFKSAFLGRVSIAPFLPLDAKALSKILDLQVAKIADRVKSSYGTDLTITEEARVALVSKCIAGDTGARALESMLSRDILSKLSIFFLDAVSSGKFPRNVAIGAEDNGNMTVMAVGPRKKLKR